MDLPGERDLPDPIDVGRAQFTTAKKGYDTGEVRSYLTEVAKGLGDYRELVKELERRLRSLEDQLESSQAAAHTEPTEEELTERLGSEAVRVLNAAREAAAVRQAEVEADVAAERERLAARAEEVELEARQKFEQARERAAAIVADARDQAETDAAEREARVEARIEVLRAEAEDQCAALVAEAEQARADGRAAGRALVAEAQVVRERILGDLAKRRQSGRRELEQIRAGRDRLLVAFNLANEEVAGLLEELTVSLPEARAAAQRAGLSVDLEDVTPEQIEHELEAARLVGHPLVAPAEQPAVEPSRAEGDVDPSDGEGSVEPPSESPDEPGAVDVLDKETDQNVVLAELGARRSRLTKAGRIAKQLPTGEIPVLKPAPAFEGVRVYDTGDDAGDQIQPPSDVVGAEAPPAGGDEPAESEASADPDTEATGGDDSQVVAADGAASEIADDGSTDADAPSADEEGEPADGSQPVDADAGTDDAEPAQAGVVADGSELVAEAGTEHKAAGTEDAEPEQVEVVADAAETADELAEVGSDGPESDALDQPVEAAESHPGADDEAATGTLVIDLDDSESSPSVPADDAATAADRPAPHEAESNTEAEHEATTSLAGDDTVELLFAKVRAARTEPAADSVATLTRASETVTVLDDDPVAARDRTTQPIEHSVARAFKRALADDQNQLLDAERQARVVETLDDLVDLDDHRDRYVDPVRADLVEAFHAGATTGGDPSVDTDLAAAETAIDVELVARLRLDLSGIIDRGDDLSDAIRQSARELRRSRLEATAAYAVLTAYNRGVAAALGQTARRWIRDERFECGPDCEANARAGAVGPSGFDGGVEHPPMFPGCRCVLVRASQ